jgi:hypothetical protein
MNHGTKVCRLCLKTLLPTILTSSLPFYTYQKDERALPGYLLTRCSFFLSDIKRLFFPPDVFSFLLLSYTILSDSLFVFGFKALNRGFISLNHVNQLIFVMVKCCVLFEVRTEFLNNI